MRDMRNGLCSLCGHNEIIVATSSDFVGESATRPLSVTAEISWSGVRHLGVFKTYVCRKCGFTQWFASRPEIIPIGDTHGTTLIEGREEFGGPYRSGV